MANKKKDTERTEEQEAFNAKMSDFTTRANILAEEIAHFLICSPLWETVPQNNKLAWLDNTCFPFVDIQQRAVELNTTMGTGKVWEWLKD